MLFSQRRPGRKKPGTPSTRSLTDRASDYGSEGCRFESCRVHSRPEAPRRDPGGLSRCLCSSELQQPRQPRGGHRVRPSPSLPMYWAAEVGGDRPSDRCSRSEGPVGRKWRSAPWGRPHGAAVGHGTRPKSGPRVRAGQRSVGASVGAIDGLGAYVRGPGGGVRHGVDRGIPGGELGGPSGGLVHEAVGKPGGENLVGAASVPGQGGDEGGLGAVGPVFTEGRLPSPDQRSQAYWSPKDSERAASVNPPGEPRLRWGRHAWPVIHKPAVG